MERAAHMRHRTVRLLSEDVRCTDIGRMRDFCDLCTPGGRGLYAHITAWQALILMLT
jgi:hypothetical protein